MKMDGIKMKGFGWTVWMATAAIAAMVACSSESDESAEQPSAIISGVDSCNVHADCVAVVERTCCPNGAYKAVNKNDVDDYLASPLQCDKGQICPLYYINETRTPQCKSNRCVMVQLDGGGPFAGYDGGGPFAGLDGGIGSVFGEKSVP